MLKKPDINQPKCIRCGKKPTRRLTPDMDCSGFLICGGCEEEVRFDLVALLLGVITEEEFYKRNKY